MDVFQFLFSDKGTTPPTGRGKFYELEEFSSAYFPAGWHIVYDRLGDGCRVDFPIRLESKLKWSVQCIVNKTMELYYYPSQGHLLR